jgi:hypothetical protein
MARSRALQSLQDLFTSQTVATLPEIQEALGAVSGMTAFRVLREVAYRRSYNYNGRYYTAYDPARFDRLGLWSFRDILFSAAGSLKATVLRMACEAPSGLTHRELADRLKVRVHNTLLDLTRAGALAREEVSGVFLYVASDPLHRADQLDRRRQELSAVPGPPAPSPPLVAVNEEAVISVLLALLRSPGSSADQVAHRLRTHAPPISPKQVQAVFARYDLKALGEKGGPSHF